MSSVPFRVKAIFEYSSAVEDDLTFPNGQIITVTDQEDEDWYTGEYMDESGTKKEGMFPRNFVEKYEPQTPPRPSRPARPKKEPEPSLPAEPVKPPPEEESSEQVVEEHKPPKPTAVEPAAPPSSLPPQAKEPSQPEPSPVAQPASRSASGAKPSPPTVAEKPTGGSLKDRIAAFNTPAAAPITPFKPSGQAPGGFIKKPFVAPPPSKNAYVYQPREPPPKVYRREEDPEVAEAEIKDIQATPMAAAVPAETTSGEPEEDQPKPTSLKERIALLQKQQLEQAARHAEAAQKKEKPKRPPKKRVESHEPSETVEHERTTELEKVESQETLGKGTGETHEAETPAPRPLPRPQKSVDSYHASPPQPSRELVSDTNDADNSGAGDTEDAEETSTGREDSDEKPRPLGYAPRAPAIDNASGEEDEDSTEEEEEEIDPEVKRRMELRERMAKMSGGYGMMGMFGPPGGLPAVGGGPKRQKSSGDGRKSSADHGGVPPVAHAPPVPIMPLPGMGRVKSPEQEAVVEKEEESEPEVLISAKHDPDEMPDIEEVETAKQAPPRQSLERGVPPPVPSSRSAPAPPLPTQTRPPPPPAPRETPLPTPPLPESRPAPPPPPRGIWSPSPGEESDDEMSRNESRLSLNTDVTETAAETMKAPPSIPIPGAAPPVPSRPDEARSHAPRPNPLASPSSPIVPGDKSKRTSRVPPIPLASPRLGSPTQSRPPPPPPPAGEPPGRKSTSESRASVPAVPKHQAGGAGSDEETTEYDGDYDTDIASGAKHKDALKAHGRDSSLDEETITDEPPQSPTSRPAARPPPPPAGAPRGAPPPPPHAQPPKSRKSTEIPRGAPPPIPPARDHSYHQDDDDYDPYNHTKSFHPQPILKSPTEEPEEDALYEDSPTDTGPPPLPLSRDLPPPPPPSQPMPAPPPTRAPPRQSMDLPPTQAPNSRRSMEAPRPSGDNAFIATDVDLAQSSIWWASPNTSPPVFQNRRDVLCEMEENSTSQRGGKKIISKDVYVLFMDYSQTIITVRFDALIPKDVSTLSQRHEPPPPRLRQDQLENAHTRFGARISDAVTSKQNTTVGDGTPQALILDLLRPLTGALLPVGTRAYGALVYANLANASTQQFDEIRPGDIVTFRNAKFQGHRGAMHQKYSVEVGKPDHVGVVVDWDGTKKKVRAWEQGRESKKVKMESFKLGELRSGEVRVWRVMARNWVGWDSGEGGKGA